MTPPKDTEDIVTKKEFLKQWLEKLQQESWQLELLISGFALFGIYEGKAWVNDFVLSLNTFGYSTISIGNDLLILLLESGWTIFFINLLIHVILRGLWIGAIGLRYVSQDINYETLGYSDRFTGFLKNKVGDYDDFIERLEKICSVLFAYTFLLFLLLLSLLIFFGAYVFLTGIAVRLGTPVQPNGFLVMLGLAYLVFGLIVFIDFVTLGGFKKIKEPLVSKIYMVIYRFYSLITFSFLYRPLLYNFIDDKYTRKLFFLSIPYIFLILFYNKIIDNEGFPHFSASEAKIHGLYVSKLNYEDERLTWYRENNMRRELDKEQLPIVTLSQFMVDKPYLEIFIKMLGNDQFLFSEVDSLSPFRKPGVNFSLFSSSEFKDPKEKELNELRLEQTRQFRDERKKYRKKRFKNKNAGYKSSLDSLTEKISIINETWEAKILDYKKERVQNTISTLLSHAKLTIDDKDIVPDLDCYKYKHPNFNEFGLLCLYKTDSLAYGKHLFSMERERYSPSRQEIRKLNRNIPFYMVK